MVDEVFITDSSDNRMDLIPIIDEGLLTEATKSIHLSDEVSEPKRQSLAAGIMWDINNNHAGGKKKQLRFLLCVQL